MDQREAMTLPGSAFYYVQRGTVESVTGLQGSPSMNSLSNPTIHFQSNTEGSLIGSTLPLDASSTMSPHGISVCPTPAMLQGEPVRRKRGRPRKYGRDGAASLALSSSTSSPVPIVRPTQKRRGRPPGTGRKQQLASLGGSALTGGGLIPHMINITVGEDVKRKILSFSQGRLATVILSGIGAISSVNLKVPNSAETRTYEGRYDLLSLSGSYTHADPTSAGGPSGGISVSLAGPDGRVMGGTIGEAMIAASLVQVTVVTLSPRISKTKNNAGKGPETSADSEDVQLVI